MLSQSSLNTVGPQSPIARDFSVLGPTLAKLLNDANGAVERDTGAARSCIAQALALLSREGVRPVRDTPAPRRCGLAPWQELRVKAYIEEHLEESIRVADLATLSRLSVSYFSGAFKRSFGVSIQTFLAHRRVERAQRLMLSTDQSLCRIALACGYCDQAHLCRQFRRMTGNTPRSWRHEHADQSIIHGAQQARLAA
jgi:AraC-like DNA-binding protein